MRALGITHVFHCGNRAAQQFSWFSCIRILVKVPQLWCLLSMPINTSTTWDGHWILTIQSGYGSVEWNRGPGDRFVLHRPMHPEELLMTVAKIPMIQQQAPKHSRASQIPLGIRLPRIPLCTRCSHRYCRTFTYEQGLLCTNLP